MEAERLIENVVERGLEEGCTLYQAAVVAAEILGLTVDRVLRAWVQATRPEQERVLAFLSQDHGSYRLASPLPSHPFIKSCRFHICAGDILATFEDGYTWMLPWDGGHVFVVRNLAKSDVS